MTIILALFALLVLFAGLKGIVAVAWRILWPTAKALAFLIIFGYILHQGGLV